VPYQGKAVLADYTPVSGTDTRVSGTKPKHCLNHEESHQGDKGKK
jgi:hypothetical protein